jgi:hypothetical protein
MTLETYCYVNASAWGVACASNRCRQRREAMDAARVTQTLLELGAYDPLSHAQGLLVIQESPEG